MDAQPAPAFPDRATFRAWAEQQPGRWEREDGMAVRVGAMAPERVDHSRIKVRAWAALRDAIEAAGVPCEAFVDGPTVEVDSRTDYEPDVVVTCGERTPGAETAVRHPVIVIEVLSPSTGDRDAGLKLEGYFRLPGIQHYLLVASDMRRVIHYSRMGEGRLPARICREGTITLDPPGLSIDVATLYEGTDAA